MNKREKPKPPPFVMLQKRVLESAEYARLSSKGVKLLVDVLAQYNGRNNGDLCLALGIMKKRGWRSSSTLHDAKNELIKGGWIELTRQGGRNRCSLFAVSMYSIDECGGKHDRRPTTKPSNLWMDKIGNAARVPNQSARISNQSIKSSHVITRPPNQSARN
jgi:hypothetical protein